MSEVKFMVASDIHGSLHYCNKMIEAFEREKADRLLILGDILYHGPRNSLPEQYDPKGVINLVNLYKEKILCVRGNCDAEVDQMVLEFPIMADYCIIPFGKRLIYATHGHRYNMDSLPPLCKGDILLHGHTHVPAWEEFGRDNYYVNPGSVSLPKGESVNSYMIIEDGSIFWKNFKGEIFHEMKF